MIGVLIIPTGIGAEIGGHAGDANPVAKLMGKCCDKLILHPNVVNASDINEMPENSLYVEGSILDKFLQDKIGLKERRRNKVLVATNKPIEGDTINAVSAARATLGLEAEIIELDTPFRMVGKMVDGLAGGDVYGVPELVSQVQRSNFDALAIHSKIEVPREVALEYYRKGGVNPWGGVEAIASKMVAERLRRPVAHAPLEGVNSDDEELYNIHKKTVDPRIAAEALSIAYLHCVLKGLSRAPIICPSGFGLNVSDVDFMVSPDGCYGPPHSACYERNIPIIFVKENKVVQEAGVLYKTMLAWEPNKIFHVENYWEAAGMIMSWKAGILPESVRRPLADTIINKIHKEDQ